MKDLGLALLPGSLSEREVILLVVIDFKAVISQFLLIQICYQF